MLWLALAAAGALAVQSADAPFRDTAVIPSFRQADPALRVFKTLSRTRADDSLDLLLVRGSPRDSGDQFLSGRFAWGRDELLGLFFQDRSRPERVYLICLQHSGLSYREVKVLRASSSELTLALYMERGHPDLTMQFFVNSRAKALVKRVDYRPFSFLRIVGQSGVPQLVAGDTKQFLVVQPDAAGRGFEIRSTAGAKPVLEGLPVDTWTDSQGEFRRLWPERQLPLRFGPEGRFTLAEDQNKPWGRQRNTIREQAGGETRPFTLPQSAWEEFAAARPGRVSDGYRKETAEIAEEIGPARVYGERLWFGKTFYDAEGTTGVGGFGYFDISSRKFVLFSPPEIRDWSVSALLVEPDAVWLGLMRRGEYTAYPGGLLKWNPATGTAQRIPLEAGINAIARHGDQLLLATEEGISVLTGNSLEHYLIGQTAQGRYEVVKR